MPTIEQFNNIGAHSRALDRVRDDRGVKDIKRQIRSLEFERDLVDSYIKSPRQERIGIYRQKYQAEYDKCWDNSLQHYIEMGKLYALGICLPALMVGTALKLSGSAYGALIGLAPVVGVFTFGKNMYAKLIAKKLIPNRIDRQLKPGLEQEKSKLEGKIAAARERLESREKSALNRLVEEENQREIGLIEDDEDLDFVYIDGIRLEKEPKKEGILNYLFDGFGNSIRQEAEKYK